MKPSLPQTIAHDIQCVKAATWNQLLRCVAWAMDHPKPDGATIFSNGDGVVSARPGKAGAAPAGGGDVDSIRVLARNTTGTALLKGWPVAVAYSMVYVGYVVGPYSASVGGYGVCAEDIPANGTGKVILAGVAELAVSGGSGNFAAPTPTGFVRSYDGLPLLWDSHYNPGTALAVLPDRRTVYLDKSLANLVYNEGEKIVVNAGRIICGSHHQDFPQEEYDVGKSGRICAAVNYDGGEWSLARGFLSGSGRGGSSAPFTVESASGTIVFDSGTTLYFGLAQVGSLGQVTRSWAGGDYAFTGYWTD